MVLHIPPIERAITSLCGIDGMTYAEAAFACDMMFSTDNWGFEAEQSEVTNEVSEEGKE